MVDAATCQAIFDALAALPSGRITRSEWYVTIKDFQPAGAALIALLAGTLAYRGALAKVRQDQQEADRRRFSERLGLFLRLRATILRMRSDAEGRISEIAAYRTGGGSLPVTIVDARQSIPIYRVPEIEEAWTLVHILPSAAIDAITAIRASVPVIISRIEAFADQREALQEHPEYVEQYLTDTERIYKVFCEVSEPLLPLLTQEIRLMRGKHETLSD